MANEPSLGHARMRRLAVQPAALASSDELAATTPGSDRFSVIAPPKNRVRYGGVAVAPANYGS